MKKLRAHPRMFVIRNDSMPNFRTLLFPTAIAYKALHAVIHLNLSFRNVKMQVVRDNSFNALFHERLNGVN